MSASPTPSPAASRFIDPRKPETDRKVAQPLGYLELLGRLATPIWVAFMATVVFGVDWKSVVEDAVNSGKPVKGAIALVLIVATLAFVAVRSLIGFARWRIQRELWRRDVEGRRCS